MNLVEYRKRHKMTQEDVAHALGITQRNYSRYEKKPIVDVLIKLSKYYNCTVDELLGIESEALKKHDATEQQNELLDLIMQLDDEDIERAKIYVNGLAKNVIKLRS